jgi:rRNA maturation protein Nop10
MSPRSKYRTVCVLWFIINTVLGFVCLYISPSFLILLFLPTLVAGVYVMRLRCPVCGNPLLHAPGWRIPTKPIFPMPEMCPNCGHDLNKLLPLSK